MKTVSLSMGWSKQLSIKAETKISVCIEQKNLLVLEYNHVNRNWSTQCALSIHHFHQ